MSVSINGTSGLVFNDASTQNTAATGFGFKNRIINGAMMIDQRNAGAATANTISGYTVDRWAVYQATTGKLIAQQNAGSVTPPASFKNYLGVTSQSAYTPSTSDYYVIQQGIEGLNIADLGYGTANAQTVTVSFWVRSSLTGTFSFALRNTGLTYSYVTNYTISAANTWQQVFVTIPGPTGGTWVNDNTGGLFITISLGAGSTFQTSTLNTWGSFGSTNQAYASTTATNVVGTNGATFYITGVQLEKGSTATSFDYRPYGTELALCQRYYGTTGTWYVWTGATPIPVFYKSTMRTTPTIAGGGSGFATSASTPEGAIVYQTGGQAVQTLTFTAEL